jgi:hypothetical protein
MLLIGNSPPIRPPPPALATGRDGLEGLGAHEEVLGNNMGVDHGGVASGSAVL